MNKLFSKVATLSVGLAMAIGVGVAVGSRESAKVEAAKGDKITSVSNIVSGNSYYIRATVNSTDYYWKAGGGDDVGTLKSGTSTTSETEATKVVFTGSGSSWSIKLPSGNYLSLPTSKNNGKYDVVDNSVNWTATDSGSLINLKINGYCLMKNSSTSLNFGSYASGQTNVWLEDATNNGPYYVTYDGNGATSGSMSDKTAYAKGSTVTIMACGFMRDNFEVVGWNTKADGSGDSYVLSGTFTINEDTTLYAQWKFSGDYTGTYVLSSKTTTYTATVTNEIFHEKVENSEPFTLSNAVNFRLGGSPNTSDIMLYGSSSFKLSAPVGYAISKVVVNGYASETGGSTLTIGGVSQTVAKDAPYVDYSAYVFGSSVVITGTSRVWAKTISVSVIKDTATVVAEAFEAAFIDMTNAECTAKAVTSGTWGKIKTIFGHIESDFEAAAELVKGHTTSVEAIARYKNIVEKYGYEDFLAKGYVQLTAYQFDATSANNSTIIIVISIAAVSVLAFTMLLVFKKKKHN